MAKKKNNINVERIGKNTERPITDRPVSVRRSFSSNNVPLYVDSNGTIIESIVTKDGTNRQTFAKSNGQPSFGFDITADRDSTARVYNPYNDFGYEKKYKPGTLEFKQAAEKAAQYRVPLATYGEAYDNMEEVKRQAEAIRDQEPSGWSILWNNITGKETPIQTNSDGGEIPSNDQQQLFVAIITDMAATLGVEPSQEFAEAVMTAFENQDDSQGLLTLFTKTKDKFMNETGLFREGGKMNAFVEKFKCGGKSPKKKTSKKQEGGEVAEEVGAGAGYITTPVNDRQMRRNWREATGGTRREARQAQRNLTNYIEGQGGISHRGARNAAAAMMGDPQRFAAPVQTPTLKPMEQAQINVPTPTLNPVQTLAPVRSTPTPTMGPIDRVQGRVNDAIDGYQRGTDRIIDGIQAGGNRVYDAVQDGARRIGDGVQNVGNRIVDGGQRVRNAVIDGTQSVGNRIVDGVQAGAQRLGQGIQRAGQRLSEWFR